METIFTRSCSRHGWGAKFLTRAFKRTAGLSIFCFLIAFGQGSIHLSEAVAAAPYTFQTVIDEARDLSESPFKSPKGEVPDSLLNITYDEWRDIRFKPPKALWRQEGLPFTIQFFHPGLYFDRTVNINVVDTKGDVRPVPFSKDLFDYKSKSVEDLVPKKLGFAGFRIHYPINTRDYQDEVCVFLGASYFRAVSQHMSYGLSARGLAVDTYLPSGEEFPYFRKFWLLLPGPDADTITFYALMDSPSLAGAYQFVVYPGKETFMDVRSTLYLRKKVQQLGIAPMTSMFFYGENTSLRPFDDFRPEVHDSDGVMMATADGEWIWRPLLNPRNLLVTSFQTTNPRGFGLCQRDQDFESYQDMESYYENRPSLWISPVGNWGEGRLQLIQIHTDEEIHDNIVAFWVPSNIPEIGTPLTFDYHMSWHHFLDGGRPPAGRVVSTRTAQGKIWGSKKFVIDFSGGALESLSADQNLTGVVDVGANAQFIEQHISKNRVNGRWRLVFEIGPKKETPEDDRPIQNPVELRAYLRLGEHVLTETWSYVYEP